jgi:hypothetical protein
VSFTANTDEGDEINVTNAAGKTCVREVPCPKFLGYGVEIEFCSADPALFAILTGQEPVLDPSGVAVGFRVNSDVSACDSGFALEVWTGVPGVACDDSTDPNASPGGYLLLPYLQGGIFGDFTVENDAISFTVTGAATKTGSGWGVGPYNVQRTATGASPLATAIEKGDHLHVQYTDVAPPPAICGTVPLLDPKAPALTSVTAAVAALEVTFTAVPAGPDPWFVDFGDGTWDYSADGSAIVHTYAKAGTYQAEGYRGSTEAEVQVQPVDTAALATASAGNGKTAKSTDES